MKVTACELTNIASELKREWKMLARHVISKKSDLVLLPEMTFSSWLAQNHNFDMASWEAAEQTHDRWITRLVDLAPAIVLVSRPVTINDRRLNEGFIWDAEEGYLAIHHKYYMPNDEGWWRFLSFIQFRLTRNRFYAMG